MEQCKRVYEDLVNKYKCLARKIDERIHWSELDITANQLSAERHKLNYRLQELEDEGEREERARVAKRDWEVREEERARVAKRESEEKEKRARVAKRDKEEREERARLAKRDREEKSRVEREEERARVIRQKIEGGKEITVYVNTRAIDRKLGPLN